MKLSQQIKKELEKPQADIEEIKTLNELKNEGGFSVVCHTDKDVDEKLSKMSFD